MIGRRPGVTGVVGSTNAPAGSIRSTTATVSRYATTTSNRLQGDSFPCLGNERVESWEVASSSLQRPSSSGSFFFPRRAAPQWTARKTEATLRGVSWEISTRYFSFCAPGIWPCRCRAGKPLVHRHDCCLTFTVSKGVKLSLDYEAKLFSTPDLKFDLSSPNFHTHRVPMASINK